MGSIHYPKPTLSLDLLPFEARRRNRFGKKVGIPTRFSRGQQLNTKWDRPAQTERGTPAALSPEHSVKIRRKTLPPIHIKPRTEVSTVAHSKAGNTMADVIARMQVREKTLLGDDLLKQREKRNSHIGIQSGENAHSKAGNTMADLVARMKEREKTLLGDDLLGQREERNSQTCEIKLGDPNQGRAFDWNFFPRWRKDSTDIGEESSPIPGFRTRKQGVAALNSQWPTSGEHLLKGKMPGLSGDGSVTSELQKMPGRYNEDEDWPSDSEAGVNDVSIPHRTPKSAEEEEFDFDEGEAEVEALRESARLSTATHDVYHKACTRLSIQPSPAFLRQCDVTTVMDLSDVRLGPADVKAIAVALVRDIKILCLDLSNNNLGPLGVSYVAEMMQENATICQLNLSATKPGRQGMEALAETLRKNYTLTHLKLEENQLEHTESDLLADIIKNVPTLKALHLGHNKLGYYGGVVLAEAIAMNRSLVFLDLHWNHIRKESAAALAKCLAKNEHLQRLNLAWNGMGKEGCLALAHSLPQNYSLRELDLSCNRVDLQSLGFLLHGVSNNSHLTTLKLGKNPLTTAGAKATIQAIIAAPDVKIEQLDIKGVTVDKDFMAMVAEAQKTRDLHVAHDEARTLASTDQTRDHEGSNLDRFDPLMVLFEYMKIDNLRVIDMFQFMDSKKREKLSKGDLRDGLNTLKLPVMEHAIDVMHKGLDLNKDGYVELDEMMKVQRDVARQVNLRLIKAKFKKREDEGLKSLHAILRELIAKRKEDNESRRGEARASGGRRGSGVKSPGKAAVTKTTGGRKASVGALQLVKPMFSVTSSIREDEETPQVQQDQPASGTD